MPITFPTLDDRRFQDLRDEAVARIAVHNPEWTNYGKSDPGITLLELFAFFFENLAYRANQIPARNRLKFLTLLGMGLQPGSSSQGLVTFSNDRGPLSTVTLTDSIEVRAGNVPFRTTLGLDVLPVEGAVYFKRPLASPTAALLDYYRQLYTAFLGQPPTDDVQLYETVPLAAPTTDSVNLGADTVNGAIWIAFLIRAVRPARRLDAPPSRSSRSPAGRSTWASSPRSTSPSSISPRAASLRCRT